MPRTSASSKRPRSQAGRSTKRGKTGRGRGFASMSPERLREVSARGGRASHGGSGRYYEATLRESPYRGRNPEYDGGRNEPVSRRERGAWKQSGRDGSARGFAAREPERRRDYPAQGGNPGYYGRDYDEGDRREAGYERGASSEYGHTPWDLEERREAARRGLRSSYPEYGPPRDYDERERQRGAEDDRGSRARSYPEGNYRDERNYRAYGRPEYAEHSREFEVRDRGGAREGNYDPYRGERPAGRGFASRDPVDRREPVSRSTRPVHRRRR